MPADTRQRIFRSAAALFRQKGYHPTSIQDIAKAAGVRSGLTYYYFDSKEALLFEIMCAGAGRTLDRVRRIDALPLDGLGKTAVVAATRVYAILNEPAASFQADVLDVLSEEHREEFLALRHQASLVIRSFIQAGTSDGSIESANPTFTALAVVGLADSILNWYRPGGAWSGHDVAAMTADLVIHMLQPAGAARRHFSEVSDAVTAADPDLLAMAPAKSEPG